MRSRPRWCYDCNVTLDELAALGRELARIGLMKHLEQCRELWRATSTGATAEWSMEHAERIAAVLGTRNALPEGSHCPSCQPPLPGTWAGARTVMVLGDRSLMACAKCGAEWVMLPHHAKVVPSTVRRR